MNIFLEINRLWVLVKKLLYIYLWRSIAPPTVYSVLPAPELSIEPTNICNSKCVFCANVLMKRRKENLSWELFTKAVDDFAAMGGTKLSFCTTIGDPLLDRDLLKRARYVKKYPQFSKLYFVTTLQWFHLFGLQEFFEAGFASISVSTVLSGREFYRDFFGVDLYDTMLSNLVILLEENERRNKPIQITISIKPTPQSIEEILRHPDYQRIRLLQGPQLDENLKNRAFFVDDWAAVSLPPYLKKRPLYPRRYRPCRILYQRLMIHSNGNFGICGCRDFESNSELILGNLQGDSLQIMWNSEKHTSLYKNWRNKNQIPKICKFCTHYVYV